MQQHSITALKYKPKWGVLGVIMATVLIGATGLAVRAAGATGVTYVVDADGQASNGNCNSSQATPYTTIGAAITAAAAGNTVKVCPGTYTEDVIVDKTLTLKGAHYGGAVKNRTFGSSSESTISGKVTISGSAIKLDGFSLTNPGQGLGVDIKNTATDATIRHNILKTVGSNAFAGPTVGVYLELGPDGVTVANNAISDVQSMTGSAQGVLVGDSTSNDPSLDTKVDGNTIFDITSVQKGAYGIQLNNGAGAGTGYTEAKIRGNTIKNLSGNWAHAVGLEGETPNVVVDNNTISGLTDTNPVPLADAIGVFFEDNPFFFTGEVNQNSLNVGAGNFGIAVAPALSAHYTSLTVDGTCNWWGAQNGPGSVGTGDGAMVTAGVDFKPFLHSSNINRDCNDGYNHNGRHYGHHDWNNRDNDDWRDD